MKNYQQLAAKECSPLMTVIKIKNILGSLSLSVQEKCQYNAIDNCHSVRVEFSDLPGIGTNGKGVTELLCLASAYAEFLERLQNGCLLGKYLEKNDKYQKTATAQQLLIEYPNLVDATIAASNKQFLEIFKGTEILSTEYYNVNKNRCEFLPESLINYAVLTNGLCAGNTPEEALVQGISELFERFACTKIQSSVATNIPSIPLTEVKNPMLMETINKMQSLGYKINIKDCSLGGIYPVVAVVFTHEKSTKYSVVFGSHPIFDIALQRCLTESFQGIATIDPDRFLKTNGFMNSDDLHQLKTELLRTAINGRGKMPKDFITSNETTSNVYQNAFVEHNNNQLLLKHVLDILKANNFTLYIKDVSCLGFPALQVYVPTMSEKIRLSKTDLYLIVNREKISKLLLNLKNLTQNEAQELFEILQQALNDSFFNGFRSRVLIEYCRIFCKPDSDIAMLFNNYYFLLTLLAFRIDNFKAAANYMQKFLDETKEIDAEDRIYYECARDHFKFKAENYSSQEIITKLNTDHDNDLVAEVVDNLSSPEKAFANYELTMDEDLRKKWQKLYLALEEKREAFKPSYTELPV